MSDRECECCGAVSRYCDECGKRLFAVTRSPNDEHAVCADCVEIDQ